MTLNYLTTATLCSASDSHGHNGLFLHCCLISVTQSRNALSIPRDDITPSGSHPFVPFLEVSIVLRVVLVAGLLQRVVKVKSIFFIDIDRRQVCAATEPPLFGAYNTRA